MKHFRRMNKNHSIQTKVYYRARSYRVLRTEDHCFYMYHFCRVLDRMNVLPHAGGYREVGLIFTYPEKTWWPT